MQQNCFEWTVIGAGPAGIVAIGKLLDLGIEARKIAWIDPTFTVGDFGTLWRNVPSNTKVELFTKFLHGCAAFQAETFLKQFDLNKADPENTCQLALMADPLQHLTQQLQKTITTIQANVNNIRQSEQSWALDLNNKIIYSKNIILAVGAKAKTLSHPNVDPIPLNIALDQTKLSKHITQNDTVAVFGASHSAVLAIRFLCEAGAKQVINFYLNPLKFAVYLDDWILFDNTGLKGTTAQWARQHLHGKLPRNLSRHFASDDNIKTHLKQCQKAVYAIGFDRRHIAIDGYPNVNYNNKSGIIAPGIFGCGIAYPEAKLDRFGNLEYSVGLWKFMDYLNRVMPVWLRYGL